MNYGNEFLIIILVLLVCGAFWLWALIDCLQNEPKEGNDRIVWALVILLGQLIGALVYAVVRRPQRNRLRAQRRRRPQTPTG
ncbi:MAG: PLDc N-terminal domain-containing protein [Candidatus Sumerlaeia bacterium]|nr:PLDc N-terminal domain-containing protein [Candidatus Sumerlaeia bacterium]